MTGGRSRQDSGQERLGGTLRATAQPGHQATGAAAGTLLGPTTLPCGEPGVWGPSTSDRDIEMLLAALDQHRPVWHDGSSQGSALHAAASDPAHPRPPRTRPSRTCSCPLLNTGRSVRLGPASPSRRRVPQWGSPLPGHGPACGLAVLPGASPPKPSAVIGNVGRDSQTARRRSASQRQPRSPMREKQIVTAAWCLVHAFHTGHLPKSSRRLQGTHVTAVPSLRFRVPHTVTLPLGAEPGLQPQWASGGRPASPSFAEVGRVDRHTSRSRRPGEASCSPFAGGGSRLPPVNAHGETRRTRLRNCVSLRGAGWEPGSVASWATGPPAHSLPGAPRRNPQKGSHHTQPRAGRGPPNVPRTRLLQPSEGLTNWWRPCN